MRPSKLMIKVPLKSQWLNVVLDVNFMTLNILKLDLFIFLEFIIKSMASLQNIVLK